MTDETRVNVAPIVDMRPCLYCGKDCNHSGGKTPYCDTYCEETDGTVACTDYDDTVLCCQDCERPNQFGELCSECERQRDLDHDSLNCSVCDEQRASGVK